MDYQGEIYHYLTIGGDWNGRSMEFLLDAFPELKIAESGTTRKDSVLDMFLTNYDDLLETVRTNAPLESEVETVSDHKTVCLEAKLTRRKAFAWETHYYLKVTPEGDARFTDLIQKEDWKKVLDASPDNHKMAQEFHNILDDAINASYSWKKVRRKTSDKPWITDLSLIHI